MSIKEIRKELATAHPDDGSHPLSADQLVGLVAADLPEGIEIKVEPPDNCYTDEHPEGYICHGTDTPLEVVIREYFPLKHWEGDLSASAYLSLMGKALTRRQKSHGDIRVDSNEINDDRWINLQYAILIRTDNVADAWARGVAVNKEIAKSVSDHTIFVTQYLDGLD